MKRNTTVILILTLISALLAACSPLGPSTVPTFMPLPPPANGTYPLTLSYNNVGSQSMELLSPKFAVTYKETNHGAVGGTASEIFEFKQSGKNGVMQQVDWGDWQNGRIRMVEYNDSNGDLLGGMIQLSVPNVSLFQWLGGSVRYTIDRSKLYLVYISPTPGTEPTLSEVVYTELWGPTSSDRWAMGATALWRSKLTILPAQYNKWGFWETDTSPFNLVTQALDSVRNGLQDVLPDFLIQDTDAAREVIGRQSGFQIFRDGNPYGDISFEYNNLFGQQPNTSLIGDGALSRIDWNLNGKYYGLAVLSPRVSPIASSLYIFTDDRATTDQLLSSDWKTLYPQLRAGMPHVLLAVHAMGTLDKVTQTISTEDGMKTVDIGSAGGLRYTTLGKPSADQVRKAHDLLAYLGEPGIKAIGLFFPCGPGCGSGLDYYISTLVLLTDPKALDVWGADVGVIDRVGFPEPLKLEE